MRRFLIAFFASALFAIPVFADNDVDPSNMVYVPGYGYYTYDDANALFVYLDGIGYVSQSDAQLYLSELDRASAPASVDASLALDYVDAAEESVSDVVEEPAVTIPEISVSAVVDDLSLEDVAVLSAVAPVSADDATGLKKIMLQLFGDYDPVVIEYRYTSGNGSYQNVLAEAQPDYPWIAAFLVFLALVWCLFKAGGAALCRR